MEVASGMSEHQDFNSVSAKKKSSPFVQRVWIALEIKGIPYQYIEVDPYQKPQSLLEVNPRGLVPALRHGDWGSYESSVLLEYVGFNTHFPFAESRHLLTRICSSKI
jgi:hypothetical protein